MDRTILKPNSYNPNHVAPIEMKLLKLSIVRDGWTHPIVATRDNIIVDGEHRWRIAGDDDVSRLTNGMVPVVRISADVPNRMAATVRHNRARGVHGISPMGQMVVDMMAGGMTKGEIRDAMGMEDEEVSRLTETRGTPEMINKGHYAKAWEPDV